MTAGTAKLLVPGVMALLCVLIAIITFFNPNDDRTVLPPIETLPTDYTPPRHRARHGYRRARRARAASTGEKCGFWSSACRSSARPRSRSPVASAMTPWW
jgi:hypothetical protein